MYNFEAYEPVFRWVAYQEFGFHRMAGLPLAASKYKTGSCRQGLLLSKKFSPRPYLYFGMLYQSNFISQREA